MEYKIINTGDYLLIVDDSEIKNYYYDFFISKLKHSNGAEYAKSDIAKQVIAHLPLNNSPILEGVLLLPPLEDEIIGKPLDNYIRERHNQDECVGFIDGYNKAKEKYKYTEEDLRRVEKCYLRECDHDIKYKGQIIQRIINEKSLQQPKMPVGFKCEIIDTSNMGVTLSYPLTKTITNSQGLTQWVGEYIY